MRFDSVKLAFFNVFWMLKWSAVAEHTTLPEILLSCSSLAIQNHLPLPKTSPLPSLFLFCLSLFPWLAPVVFLKLKVSQSDLSLNSCKTPHSLDFCPSLKPKAVTHRPCEPLSGGAAPNKVWKHSPRSSTIWDTVAISTFILLYLFNCLDTHYLSY